MRVLILVFFLSLLTTACSSSNKVASYSVKDLYEQADKSLWVSYFEEKEYEKADIAEKSEGDKVNNN
ncbi:hypothetical protein N9W34_05815 [Rickettsiales bacterium]|nr:hypothetical protein [Rickettsiales bacterium]